VLRWPADGLIERVNERIKRQIEKVEEMTGDMDAKTNFSLIVIQTELERWKYLVRGYLRARVAKVCRSATLCWNYSLPNFVQYFLTLLSAD
jgi:GINS complex subunit 4